MAYVEWNLFRMLERIGASIKANTVVSLIRFDPAARWAYAPLDRPAHAPMGEPQSLACLSQSTLRMLSRCGNQEDPPMEQASIKSASRGGNSSQYSQEEWDVRVKLAACYRLSAKLGMTDYLGNHITARVPGARHEFLINPLGLFFHEVTASSLIRIDLEGNILEETPYKVNKAGYVIHSAIHRVREDVESIVHNHAIAGAAVSAQSEGLLPITQNAMQFYNRIGYHDYEAPAVDMDECERLAADLGNHNSMILRNHGLLTCGRSIEEAFILMVNLESACRMQIAAQAGGAALIQCSPEVAERTASGVEGFFDYEGGPMWPALLRMIEDQAAGYAS